MSKKQPLPTLSPEPLVEPSKISSDDNDYLLALSAQRQQAELLINNFSAYLAQKYKLVDGDSLQPDGTIVHKPVE